ncbi:PilZ domain-containing protein [Halorhodospira halochloris]|uniref:PilZ domain-containing protein n=1 Tax=Halorhodospira halochloris TaxID=1052 RepID=UPI001EE8278C|nr:PilZ domain-containing protein [Halorhodospira halochloris]MCG5547366.1 PilZ domain-containing protein [Halorhodospira halochloris]
MSETTPAAEARRELRHPIESITLPFLGSRGDNLQPFQYLLRDVSSSGVGVFLPSWLTNRERLRQGDPVFFHLPFFFGERRILNQGYVTWQRYSEDETGQMVGARLTSGAPLSYPLAISIDDQQIQIDLRRFKSPEALAQRIIHDSVLLKRGILIYLRHLESLFSRVSDLDRVEYGVFREQVIGDVRRRIQDNLAYLEPFDLLASDTPEFETPITDRIDLDEFRAAMEPEINLELFEFALGTETSELYLGSIKTLEHRLYLNYNAYVMIYIQAL